MKKIRIGINGFGRIGRVAARIISGRTDAELAAINSRADAASHAHLLTYDSSYGVFNHKVKAEGNHLTIDGRYIAVYQKKDPSEIPWREANVDIVFEATGAFRSLEEASKHLTAGAKRVIVSAPPKDNMPTFCMGVNEKNYDHIKDTVVSNASCTTNCLSTVAKVLHDEFEIIRGFMTTTHSYTDSQNLLDNSHKKDLRLARAAACNIIPSDTGASRALGLVLPDLRGKIISSSIRVPTPTVSLIDLTVEVGTEGDADDINKAFERAAKESMNGILAISYEPLVSTDLKGSPYSSIVDGLLTKTSGNMISVKAWYDNEWGYATRLVDLAEYVGRQGV